MTFYNDEAKEINNSIKQNGEKNGEKLEKEVIEIDDLKYIYNDDLMKYEAIANSDLKKPEQTSERYVCNIESFAKAVIEENTRRKDEVHIDGKNRTIVFNADGAIFYVDDLARDLTDKWIFKREFTLLWHCVSDLIENCRCHSLSHKQLILALESIKDFIPGYDNLYNAISKLHINKKLNFVSNPIFEDGGQMGQFGWEQRVENGQTEHCACPAEIVFRGAIVRGSPIQYEFSIRLTPVLDEQNGKIFFSVAMPLKEAVIDQIREDEYKEFCNLVKDLQKLLILRNY